MTIPMPTASVVLEGVSKRFGDLVALDAICAQIEPGQLTGIAGPDGAGKTTLMRLMAGLLTPTQGHIKVAGFDTVVQMDEVKGVIGYMPQRFGLYEDLSVMDNLLLYSRLRNVPPIQQKALFDRLLDFTRLESFTDRLAGKLSGGMKQKLGLACALMGQPKVLLLDEPGVGVDPVSRQDLWAMVGALTSEGMAVVWSTAYLDEAERCATVLLMDHGKIVFQGQPSELTDTLKGRSFKLTRPKLDRRETLRRALNLPAVCDGVIQGEAVRAVVRSGADLQQLRDLAEASGAGFEPTAPRFEDAFIDLLGGAPGGESALAESYDPVGAGHEIAVSCENLTKAFGAFKATADVSFQVKRGEVFGLLGPNGAGKSTTFKMLCGLLKPSSGSAQVMGHDFRSASGKAKMHLGYMAQKFSLYGLMTVGQNLAFSAGVYGLSGALKAQRIAQMVETFDLAKWRDTAPGDLPLGLRQRLALACALMHRPPILFLDEPTSGVDPVTRREFWTHINGLARKGVTIMVTTHFMDEAEYCDRIALMSRGVMIALDAPDVLKAQAKGSLGGEVTMEEAFIALIQRSETQERSAA
jgi:ABC-2 type transport system ATP-binding protein